MSLKYDQIVGDKIDTDYQSFEESPPSYHPVRPTMSTTFVNIIPRFSGDDFAVLAGSGPRVGAKLLETVALFVVPFSYCFVFAATQGLVSAFDSSYGHRFWVFVNACFLLPGLPCALLQARADLRWDIKYGSALTFQVRMAICFLGLIGAAVALILDRSKAVVLVSLTVVGFMTWFAHGTCSQLAQMFPPQDTIMLQAGMQASNLLALVLVLAMQLSSKSIHSSQIDVYYGIALAVTAVGAVTWTAFINRTDKAFERLALRDTGLSRLSMHPHDTNTISAEDKDSFELVGEKDTIEVSFHQEPTPVFEPSEEHNAKVRNCVISLFLTIVCSNVMGCLFTYIKGSGDLNITTALVYCRLLSDALSRPITNCWRPKFALSPKGLLGASLVRTGCLSIFFIYQADFFRADWFIMLFVVVYSFFSGILTTFSYVASQEACQHEPSGGIRELALTRASGHMNIAFNAAGFVGVAI